MRIQNPVLLTCQIQSCWLQFCQLMAEISILWFANEMLSEEMCGIILNQLSSKLNILPGFLQEFIFNYIQHTVVSGARIVCCCQKKVFGFVIKYIFVSYISPIKQLGIKLQQMWLAHTLATAIRSFCAMKHIFCLSHQVLECNSRNCPLIYSFSTILYILEK